MTRTNCKYGFNCYRKNHNHFNDFCHPGDYDWSLNNSELCPCGGGQSCMVDRRALGDWVPEDNIFKQNNLPIRKNCYSKLSKKQLKVLEKY